MSAKISAGARLLLCVLLAFSIILPTGSHLVLAESEPPAGSAETVTLSTEMLYGQTEARTMLGMINAFRAEPGVWYWNSDNTTKTEYNVDGGTQLEPLVYDYDLEAAAMVRASEVALLWSHSRPNGETCYTAFPDGYSAKGENLALGGAEDTALRAFTALQETNDPYSGQGHRRNMLNPIFNCVGFGHCRINGIDYWVQLLGYKDTHTSTPVSPVDTVSVADITVKKDIVSFSDVTHKAVNPSMEFEGEQDAPDATMIYTIEGSYPAGATFRMAAPLDWTSSNPDVVSISDGKIKAGNVGSAVISAKVEPIVPSAGAPDAITYSITVSPISISGSDATLEYSEIEYTGKELKPAVTKLTKNGKELPVTNTDCFTVSYSDNVKVGTGKVTITAAGNYTGSVTKTFTIKECQHVFDAGTVVSNADCTHDGARKFECTKCDFSKTEAIKATGHTAGPEATCTADQTCTVCKAVIKAKLGHTPESGKFVCTADQKCKVCGESYHKAGSHTPGPAATCSAAQTCTVCGTEIAPKTAHTPGAAATCTTDQTCTVCKEVIKKATGHTAGAAATCGSDQKCTVCSTVLNKATGKHTAGAAATCNTPQKCTVCGAVVTKATGKHTDANNDTKCDVCGTDVSGKGPTTGEIIRSNLPVIIASAAVLVSIAAIIVVIIKQRKNRNNG